MPTKAPPRIKLEHVFVRDHQRRLRLVLELLEQDRRQHGTLTEKSQPIPVSENWKSPVFTSFHAGGESL
jgi:hypothetical protein